jgi:arginase
MQQNSTVVLSTNLWFGSPHSAQLTEGTRALEVAFTYLQPIVQYRVDSSASSATVHGIRNFRLYRDALHEVRATLVGRKARKVVLLGGGCAAAIAVIPYLASIHPDLRLIWIDAHGDLNIPSTSESGYIHGMALGALIDAPTRLLFSPDASGLDPAHIALCGQKVLDPYEREVRQKLGIRQLSVDGDFASLGDFLSRSGNSPVYLHIDLDVLHPDSYLNPKCTVPAGLDLRSLSRLLAYVQQRAPVAGFSVAENFETDPGRLAALARAFHGIFTGIGSEASA